MFDQFHVIVSKSFKSFHCSLYRICNIENESQSWQRIHKLYVCIIFGVIIWAFTPQWLTLWSCRLWHICAIGDVLVHTGLQSTNSPVSTNENCRRQISSTFSPIFCLNIQNWFQVDRCKCHGSTVCIRMPCTVITHKVISSFHSAAIWCVTESNEMSSNLISSLETIFYSELIYWYFWCITVQYMMSRIWTEWNQRSGVGGRLFNLYNTIKII